MSAADLFDEFEKHTMPGRGSGRNAGVIKLFAGDFGGLFRVANLLLVEYQHSWGGPSQALQRKMC